ncbi:signal peptidase I [Nocardioides sp. SYSU D00038]|uniref:signal peptidase I n=1 Tax=Nocardioides sp. SYSU D00038 TaxID=2812554 RepID=UPI0019672DA0|nr:signal peptidase I [Nocardioides sp. SYSU D00038]
MRRRLRELVLWAGAALGLLAVLAGVAVAWLGFSFLVFRSGSMSPEIETGALALARTVPAADLRAGDVVSVLSSTGDRVTHRVVSSTLRGDEATLVLQGDANSAPDDEVYRVTEVERVWASVPWGGYVVAHALTPPGLLAAACLSLMLVVVGWGAPAGTRDRRPRRPRLRRGPPRHAAARRRRPLLVGGTVVLVGALGATLLGARVDATLARFTDQATVTTGAFSAQTLRPPATIRCFSPAAGAARIEWTPPTSQVPAPTGYRLTWIVNGTVVGYTYPGPAERTAQPPPGFLLGDTTFSVTVATRYGTSWVSAETGPARIRAVTVVVTTYSCPA